ncbi:hypothetical protein [Actinomadura harenae]|uniref:Uncharacterized protein n=1 Tax=Actinomadura harenae TaxID=2483351 RepID=A0A3M2L4I0_9ACTN|nr:hypothetical protein [Actinomadura harenae]RMI32481.1 hypothetical protein EBO15_41975 [Actinomadura harenae]
MTKKLLRVLRWATKTTHPAEFHYSPDLNPAEQRALLRRNYLLLMTGQAALGLIGPDILAIAVEPRPDEVVLHIAASTDNDALQEDLKDIVGDLDAFLASGPERLTPISTQIHVGSADTSWSGRSHALLYLAKPEPEPPIHNS